jgi:polysaccharide export outer membrane protein
MNSAGYVRWSTGGVAALLTLGMSFACSSTHDYVWVQDLPDQDETPRIRVGDTLSVLVKGQDSLSGDFPVREDGTYLQPVVGPIPVVGKTASEVEIILENELADGIVTSPDAAVAIGESKVLQIHVLGEVEEPGTVEADPDDTLLSVLAKAGGLTEFARRNHIYVVRKKPEVLRVRFRYADLAGGDPDALAFQFKDGDAVVVE